MSNQANYIPTDYPLNDLTLLENNTNELMNEWKHEIFYSHDAPYILRKRSLLLDLCTLEAPCESEWKEALFSGDMLTDSKKSYSYQHDFLQEPLKINEKILFEEEFSYNIDNTWHLDCNMTVQ